MLENVNDIITSMYQKGFDAEQIAEIFETDIKNISYYLGSTIQNRKKSDIITPSVCEMFKDNKTIHSIAQYFHVSRSTIRFILRKEGLQEYIPTPEEAWIITLHEEGLSYKQIGEKVGLDESRVGWILRRNGISTEKKTRVFHQKRYHFNENFFDKIENEEKSYWLGFLYADGCVTNRGVTSLGLAEKDKEHVVKFAKAIGLDKEPTYCRNTRSYRIDACSKHMVDMLNKQGCLQNKSLILRFPNDNQVPISLVNHFMRGYFDGDGYVRVYEPKGLSRFEILGTPQFLDVYEDILLNHCKNNTRTKRIVNSKWNENTQAIMYCGHRLEDIFCFLYNNATIFLDRKYNMFKKILTRPESNNTEGSGL